MPLLYYESPVAVFTPEARRALARVTSLWQGEGTATILPKCAFEAIDQPHDLPPIARYPMSRSGICIVGYSFRLAPLFYRLGGSNLLWWGWSATRKALLAADWQYQRAVDDPVIAEIIQHLFGQPVQAAQRYATAEQPTFLDTLPNIEHIWTRELFRQNQGASWPPVPFLGYEAIHLCIADHD